MYEIQEQLTSKKKLEQLELERVTRLDGSIIQVTNNLRFPSSPLQRSPIL